MIKRYIDTIIGIIVALPVLWIAYQITKDLEKEEWYKIRRTAVGWF